MTPRETDHIGNQAVLAMQSMVSLLIDGGLPVPAERLQRLLDKLARVGRGKFALCFILRNQRQAAGVKILRRARIASARSRRARFSISSRRSSEVKIRNGLRASAASSMGRNAVEWTRHAGLREIVIANGIHPHDGKHATERRQFFRCAHANRAVALHV